MAPKAVTEKWEITKRTALFKLNVANATVRKWKQRRAVPGTHHIALIRASGGKLSMADFVNTEGDGGTI